MKTIPFSDLKIQPNYIQASEYQTYFSFGLLGVDKSALVSVTVCKSFVQDTIALGYFDLLPPLEKSYYINSSGYKKRVDFERLPLMVGSHASVPENQFKQELENVADLLNQMEKLMGFMPTEIQIVVGLPDEMAKTKRAALIIGDKRWMVSIPMVSLYMLLCRVGPVHTVGIGWEETLANIANGKITPNYPADRTYIRDSLAVITKIVKDGFHNFWSEDPLTNYEVSRKAANMGSSTHADGIYNFATSYQRI